MNVSDRDAIREKGLLLLVADGMGGLEGGKAASETVIAAMKDAFSRFDAKQDLADQLDAAVRAADSAVYRKLGGKGGSTLVSGLIRGEELFFSSVGDSYIFLLRDCSLFRLNRSQNVLNRDWLEGIRRGELDPYTARRNPEKDAITQFLGMDGLDEIDSLRHPMKLRLCSDGVGGVLSMACLQDCLSHGRPADMAKELEREIGKCALKYQDNYTALIVQCRG